MVFLLTILKSDNFKSFRKFDMKLQYLSVSVLFSCIGNKNVVNSALYVRFFRFFYMYFYASINVVNSALYLRFFRFSHKSINVVITPTRN